MEKTPRLTQSGEQEDDTAGRFMHMERHESRFRRSIPLPPDADHENSYDYCARLTTLA